MGVVGGGGDCDRAVICIPCSKNLYQQFTV